jgi:hypothetical protein
MAVVVLSVYFLVSPLALLYCHHVLGDSLHVNAA